jgi:hypothetical protein
MRGLVPRWVPVILGVCLAACSVLHAQTESEQPAGPAGPPVEVQVDSGPFAEESRQLENAADNAARKLAFEAILNRAKALETNPDPLLSILRNKRPEATYQSLLRYLRDTESARLTCFIAPLVLLANESGDDAVVATQAVRAYGKGAVPVIVELLKAESSAERLAAASITRQRIGGVAGIVRVVPHLVEALKSAESEFAHVINRSLRELTLLDHSSVEAWQGWVEGKSELDLIVEIADREAEARTRAEQERKRIETDLLEVLIERIKLEQHSDAEALVAHLRESQYLAVRVEALKLLRALLPELEAEPASDVVAECGRVLLEPTEEESLRRLAAAALADSGKPALAFPHIDAAIKSNGLSSDLRLKLVRGLNSPLAANRLAQMLEAEVDMVEQRSSELLEPLIGQVRSVLSFEDRSEASELILAQLDRLLGVVLRNLNGEVEAPARRRFIDLAARTGDVLVHVARLRRVDISVCAENLVRLATSETGAGNPSITALRQGLSVPGAQQTLREKIKNGPLAEELSGLYQRLLSGNDEAILINLLGLYEDLALSPEPVEVLRLRLLERAQSTEANLPSRPEARRSVRDALRALLARVLQTPEQHAELIRDLMSAPYGKQDALGYLLVLNPPRVEVLVGALQPMVEDSPIRIALLVIALEDNLTSDEREDRNYRVFRSGLDSAVRAEFAAEVTRVLTSEADEQRRGAMTDSASGPLRGLWLPAALRTIREHPAPGEARDFVVDTVLLVVRQAHPEKYDDVSLNALNEEDFLAGLDELITRLREDGYNLP